MRRLLKNSILPAIVLSLVYTGLVFADQTAAILPSSDGAYTQWTPSTGTSHFSLVDETSCNGTTDYNSTNTVGNRDSYGLSLSSVPDGSTITKIDITPCASKNGSGGSNSTMNVFYRLNGVNSSDAGNYSLSGTTPSVLATTSFSSLSTVKSPTTTLEVGAILSAGTKGARLSHISTKITYTPLSTPSALTAVAVGSTVNLNWTDNSSNEDGFRIERSDNGGAFVEIDTVGQDVHSYSDISLSVGTYAYRVRAYNSGGNSGYTSSATAYVLLAPSSLTAVATNSASVMLSWADNSSGEDGYKIEVATGAGSFVQFKTVGPNVTSYYDANPSRSPNDYHYRVRAYKSTSNSDYSNTADATVLNAPSGLFTSVSGSDITLNWTDNSSSEDGFRIERRLSGGTYVEIDLVGADTTTYFDPGLTSGTYEYRIRAYKGSDRSSYSASASATIF